MGTGKSSEDQLWFALPMATKCKLAVLLLLLLLPLPLLLVPCCLVLHVLPLLANTHGCLGRPCCCTMCLQDKLEVLMHVSENKDSTTMTLLMFSKRACPQWLQQRLTLVHECRVAYGGMFMWFVSGLGESWSLQCSVCPAAPAPVPCCSNVAFPLPLSILSLVPCC